MTNTIDSVLQAIGEAKTKESILTGVYRISFRMQMDQLHELTVIKNTCLKTLQEQAVKLQDLKHWKVL